MSDPKARTSTGKNRQKNAQQHRLKRLRSEGHPPGPDMAAYRPNATVDCGWGRLIFAQTFETPEKLAEALRAERPDRRDIAFDVRDPHVVLSMAPQEMFLDPSHTFRLDFSIYRPAERRRSSFFIRRLSTRQDAEAANRIYAARGMVHVPTEFFWSHKDARTLTVMVAEDAETGKILGTVMGVDHVRAFNDPEHGSSLWCLAVAPDAPHAGIGETLVRQLAEHFQGRGFAYMDLSVMHDNEQAIALYEKLGFRRVPVFSIKRKNHINEKLYTGQPEQEAALNPYTRIIVDEARRRGITAEIISAESGLFRLCYGGRAVTCRESLSEFTSAVAMTICDDKQLTRQVVQTAEVKVPAQIEADGETDIPAFLAEYGMVVVKPARGEQGKGVAVGLSTMQEVEEAIDRARLICSDVLVEEYYDGMDLRLVVIDSKVVACAIRRPPHIIGDGITSIKALIATQSRRRAAATGGESTIPLDDETKRCVRLAGFGLDDILPQGQEIMVRKTANLHTGGTIIDVTAETHPTLIEAATSAAKAIDIPVTGIDLMVKSPHEADYVFIEANERPGLANHEPQPTAERFIDLLFPLSVPAQVRENNWRQSR